MIVNIFKGQLRHDRSNSSAYVRFRETEKFWIDQTGRKFRKTDGSFVGQKMPGNVRLLLSTVTRCGEPRTFHRWDLTGRVRSNASPAALTYMFRETEAWYVDEHGTKYDKKTGWSTCGNMRVVRDSIKPAKLLSRAEMNRWEEAQRKNSDKLLKYAKDTLNQN